MSKFSAAAKRFGGFMKRNAFYFLIILCIASVATVIALAVTRNNHSADNAINSGDNPVINPEPDDRPSTSNPEDEQPVKKLTFVTPCNGTVKGGYSDAELVWNESMQQFETHTALDFVSDDLNVYATADGVVKEIGYNNLDGHFVTIAHSDGYTSKYMSLESAPTLKAGATVKQGQLIGRMSTTQGHESLKSAHLHFELYKDNELINPLEVLVLDEK